MIELLLSASITLLPDYLFRRYVQGKRIGHEITLYSVWYELRWGIVSCAALAITLVTVIFYFHPAMTNVIAAFRTVTIISERPGRVAEVFVSNNQSVAAGAPIFRLDTDRQEAAAATARLRIAEIDAAVAEAEAEIDVALGDILSAEAALREARDDLARREEVFARNPANVSVQEIERLRATVDNREGALEAARARRGVIETRIARRLPAERARAEAELAQAEVEIAQSTVFAGTDGTITQFALRAGDIVSPILRPAGILIPEESGRLGFVASFPQIAGQIVQVGMITEITCPALPLTVIPMRIVDKQEAIAVGQIRPTDTLAELDDRMRPGSILVFLEPVFAEKTGEEVPRGASCIGVSYSNHENEIANGELEGFTAFLMTVVDGMGLANAIVIRAQALLLPIRSIVFQP